MEGRRLIGTVTNHERYELKANRHDLNMIIFVLRKAVENGGMRYEDAAKYVELVDKMEHIRDGEVIDELEEE